MYPVVFIDAIRVKIRDGQVANRSVDVAIGVSCASERDILGLWAGDGSEGAKFCSGRELEQEETTAATERTSVGGWARHFESLASP